MALAAGTSGQSRVVPASPVCLFLSLTDTPAWQPIGLGPRCKPPRLSLISREASLVWHATPSCLLREIKPKRPPQSGGGGGLAGTSFLPYY